MVNALTGKSKKSVISVRQTDIVQQTERQTDTLFKIKVLHDAIEEHFFLNGPIKNLLHLKNLSVSQKVLCGELRFFRLKVRKRWFFKEFFVEPKMVLLWHCLKNLLKLHYF